MAKSRLRYNEDGLNKLAKSLEEAKGLRARIGILGNKPEREEGDTNAEIGAKHEFGFTVTEGAFKGARVPARSFLRLPFQTQIQQILKAVKPSVMPLLASGKVLSFFLRLGIEGEKLVDQAFRTSGWGFWAANAPTTVMLKGSDKPLIDTGALRRSISSVVTKV